MKAGRGRALGVRGMVLALLASTLTLGSITAAPPASGVAESLTFTFTGGTQTWTVPAGVARVSFDVYGAQGGAGVGGGAGGLGGRATATITVTEGQTLQLTVGGAGGTPTGGPGGSDTSGGAGGFGFASSSHGGGGGGASDVRSGSGALADRIIVAGGGGGGGGCSCAGAAGGAGGAGGDSSGVDGADGAALTTPGGGDGATQAQAGNGGVAGNTATSDSPGSPGDPGGGAGGAGGSSFYSGGGGGGGGFYGGGGGGSGYGGGGGGGGSGFGPTGVVFQSGVQSGDGQIVISYTQPDVTIDQAAGQVDPTSGSPINFTAVFTEPVTGFTGSDVTLSGTAGATTATVTETAPNDGTTYNVAVSGMTTGGTVTAGIAAGVATDAAGNANTASSSTDNPVTFVVVPVSQADLSVTKSDSPDPVVVNGTLVYRIRVKNNGPQAAQSVQLTDTLPGGVTYQGALASRGSCSRSGSVVTCNLGTISSGGTVTVYIAVRATQPGTLSNTATAGSSTHDPNTADNSATELTAVQAPPADLRVTKTDSPDPVKVGDRLTYQIRVRNNGPQAAQSVQLTDTLPGGVTYQSARTSEGSCSRSGNVVTCNVGRIRSGETVTVSIVVKPTQRGALSNTATASSSTYDPNTANNTDSEPTTVR